MSERKHDESQHTRPPVPEYDRFGFRGHFEPSCGPSEDRSSVDIYSELNREPSNS
jgi:hypothetical protein